MIGQVRYLSCWTGCSLMNMRIVSSFPYKPFNTKCTIIRFAWDLYSIRNNCMLPSSVLLELTCAVWRNKMAILCFQESSRTTPDIIERKTTYISAKRKHSSEPVPSFIQHPLPLTLHAAHMPLFGFPQFPLHPGYYMNSVRFADPRKNGSIEALRMKAREYEAALEMEHLCQNWTFKYNLPKNMHVYI